MINLFFADDFMRPQPEGVLCLYTLKNPSFPEYAFQTESGITCVDIHKKYTSFICIGMYDGNVAIYNAGIREGGTSKPISKSSPVKTKHGGIVWQVVIFNLKYSIKLLNSAILCYGTGKWLHKATS